MQQRWPQCSSVWIIRRPPELHKRRSDIIPTLNPHPNSSHAPQSTGSSPLRTGHTESEDMHARMADTLCLLCGPDVQDRHWGLSAVQYRSLPAGQAHTCAACRPNAMYTTRPWRCPFRADQQLQMMCHVSARFDICRTTGAWPRSLGRRSAAPGRCTLGHVPRVKCS